MRSTTLGPRLALSPDEAAAPLGASRDYFDDHGIAELRIVRCGRRILIALAELERWLDRTAGRATVFSSEERTWAVSSGELTTERLASRERKTAANQPFLRR
jgi:hypothetical protein